MKINKLMVVLSMTAVLAAGALAGCTSDEVSSDAMTSSHEQISTSGTSKTVIKIDGESIPLAEARVYMLNYQNIYGRMYGADVMSKEDKVKDFTEYIKDISITTLARTVTMSKLADEQELSLDATTLEEIEKVAGEYYSSLNDTEKEYLGVSESDINDMYVDYALANKVYENLTKSVNLEVSDDEARVMRAKRIFVSSDEALKKVKKALNNNTEFDVVASEYNEKADLDINISRGDLPDEVISVAFALENDEISEPVAADGGYYIIKCINKFDDELSQANKVIIADARKTDAFDKVYNEYKSQIRTSLVDRVWNKEILYSDDALLSDSFFQIYEDHFKTE